MAIINGNSADNVLIGTEDDDEINGFGGDDTLDGDDGRDILNGGTGDDVIRGGIGQDIAILNISTDGADRIDLGSGLDFPDEPTDELDQAIDRVIVEAAAPGQVRLTFTSAEVGNGAVDDSNTSANQDGGLAVRLQAEDGGGGLTGPVTRVEDEAIVFEAREGVTFDVRDLVSGVQRGDDFDKVWLGTDASEFIDVQSYTGPEARARVDAEAVTDPFLLNHYANGGAGDDAIFGYNGDDFLVGGLGDDELSGARGDDRLIGGAGGDVFFYFLDPDSSSVESGADTILDFQKNDLFVSIGALRDGNDDGRIVFGRNGVLNIGGDDSVTFAGLDPASGLRFLGSSGQGGNYTDYFYYADAATRPAGAIEGTIKDDVLDGSADATRFFFDTALEIDAFSRPSGFGDDLITGFGADDLLVTTTAIADSDGDGRIGFGTDRVLDLSDGTSVTINDGAVRALKFDGEVTTNGATYYVYSLVGSRNTGVDDLFG